MRLLPGMVAALDEADEWMGGKSRAFVIEVLTALYAGQLNAATAKLVVVGMVSNGFTIADPSDAGMLDVVGFDTNVPAVMADFARQ